jgi:hypothetical protein
VELGERLGVPMPSTSAVYACVKFLGEQQARPAAALPAEAGVVLPANHLRQGYGGQEAGSHG